MADDIASVEPADPFILAGEYALGVLEGDELADASARHLRDAGFADMVRWWNTHLAAIAEEAGEVPVPAELWPAIEARIAAMQEGESDMPGGGAAPRAIAPARGPSKWNVGLLIASGALAASAAAFFIMTPRVGDVPTPMETAAPGAGPQLIAQLQDESGDIRLAGRVREDDGQIVLNLAGFQPGENQSPVLWVIPVGADAPVALGTIPAQGRFERQLSAQERELIASGATLAVTIEDDANAPYAAPTTPILVAGTLDQV